MTGPDVGTSDAARALADQITVTCPACLITFPVWELRTRNTDGDPRVLGSDGNGLSVPRTIPAARALAQRHVPLLCTADRPHEFPERYFEYPTHVIGMAGMPGIGKSHYLFAAVEAAIKGSAPLVDLGVRLGVLPGSVGAYQERFANMLNEAGRSVLPPNPEHTVSAPLHLIATDIRTNRTVNLLFQDVSGEQQHDPAMSPLRQNALKASSAILYFITPECIRFDDTDSKPFTQSRNILENIGRDLSLNRPEGHQPPPLHVIIGKMDTLLGGQHRPDWWDSDPDPEYDDVTRTVHRIGEESADLRTLLEDRKRWKMRDLVLAAESRSFAWTSYHAVAAIGSSPIRTQNDKADMVQHFEPRRCLDPLVVILCWLGMIAPPPWAVAAREVRA